MSPVAVPTVDERRDELIAAHGLSTLDRLLPLWIGAAMLLGIVLGRAFPDLNNQPDQVKIGTVSLPIAIGLFAMMYGLLFTIVILFALQGDRITNQPRDVARIALPLLAYFAMMWFGSFYAGMRMQIPYDRNASIAFTAAGNNFELAIAVAIGVFGVSSGQALAGVVGPLIEMPVLVGLVYVALWARSRYCPREPGANTPAGR